MSHQSRPLHGRSDHDKTYHYNANPTVGAFLFLIRLLNNLSTVWAPVNIKTYTFLTYLLTIHIRATVGAFHYTLSLKLGSPNCVKYFLLYHNGTEINSTGLYNFTLFNKSLRVASTASPTVQPSRILFASGNKDSRKIFCTPNLSLTTISESEKPTNAGLPALVMHRPNWNAEWQLYAIIPIPDTTFRLLGFPHVPHDISSSQPRVSVHRKSFPIRYARQPCEKLNSTAGLVASKISVILS